VTRASVRLRLAQASFLAAAALLATATYGVLTQVVVMEPRYIDSPAADVQLPPVWRFEPSRLFTQIRNIEAMR